MAVVDAFSPIAAASVLFWHSGASSCCRCCCCCSRRCPIATDPAPRPLLRRPTEGFCFCSRPTTPLTSEENFCSSAVCCCCSW
uniref:Putative secreted peptide n=1 Tax=Anopheles braziliensis TaxID=58242 RepID=A0A2M3ZQV3_9DIPT